MTIDANDGTWWRFRTATGPAGFSKLLPANGATAQPRSLTRRGVDLPGNIPTTSRVISAVVPWGSYTLGIAASNECGSSASTPGQTVSIR